MDSSLSCEILVRGTEGFHVWNGPPFIDGEPSVKLGNIPCSNVKFCDDGSRLVIVQANSTIIVYDCGSRSFAERRTFQIFDVLAVSLSSRGTYLQTFQKPTSQQDKNVSLWDTDTGVSVYQHFQKTMTKTNWPSFHFSFDESVVCHMSTHEIKFFDPKDFSKGVIYQLRVPQVVSIELSKVPGSHVAAFVPEHKGRPASVQIFSCAKDLQSEPVARRSFFQCSTVQLDWNRGSTGLLVVALCDVDKTNQNYYGVSQLHYLTTDGSHVGLVPLKKEGPIHDVQWSYSGSEFAVVYGFMPARITLFDKKCNPLLELGSGPYNTVRWNPKGKFVCLAGFGNLPGDVAFWDYVNKKQIGTTKAECSVTSEWSPDGRFFITATTAPRLKVDNGIKIFHYDGSLYFEKAFDKLYQVEWKPESLDRFDEIEELAISIDSVNLQELKPKGKKDGLERIHLPNSSSNSKPVAYRPPHAKNLAETQLELFGGITSKQMSKGALKNKKRREKQKEKRSFEPSASTLRL